MAGVFPERSEAGADVLRYGVDRANAPRVAALVLDLGDAAEALLGKEACLRGIDPTLDERLGLELEMELQLGVHALFERRGRDRAAQAADDCRCARHAEGRAQPPW